MSLFLVLIQLLSLAFFRMLAAMIVLVFLGLGTCGEVILLHLRLIKNARVVTAVEIDIRPREKMVGKKLPAVAQHVAHHAFPTAAVVDLKARADPRR